MQDRKYRRYHYVIAAVTFIDLPLWIELRHQEWILAGLSLGLMLALTARRMAQIGWDKLWVYPYCCAVLCPLSMLVFWPSLSPWVTFSCMAALHIPVMVWPPATREAAGA